MKYIHKAVCFSILAIILAASQFSCKKTDGYNSIVSTDKTKPGIVTNVKIVNFNGGAYITYTLPNSPNILYVQASYMINDKAGRQTKSSYYSDSITVSGFAKSQDYTVTLWVVTRAEVKSDPVTVTVHPDTPAYLLMLPTMKLSPDFGGANITGSNKLSANIGVIVISPDNTKKLQIVNQNYTNLDTVNYSIRGYDTTPRLFGVYITDQWNNISDTIYSTITPLFEVQMNKSLFKGYVLPTDVVPYDAYRGIQNLWDNNIKEPTYNTQQPITPLVWPSWMTFDMGQTAKLSRYNMVGRTGDSEPGEFMWGYGTPQTWVIWGRPDVPVDQSMPDSTGLPPLGQATSAGWINMGEFYAPPKPSGLQSPLFTSADLAFWQAGFPFNFDISLPKVRYIRFECLTNMGGTNNFFDINELTFYGDPR
jgi:uncharacterized protein DUF4959/uncharacterized protein DUF5126/uncharacterized protein DUF5000